MNMFLWYMNVGFTATLVILQPLKHSITKGVMVVNPRLARSVDVVIKISKYISQVISLIALMMSHP